MEEPKSSHSQKRDLPTNLLSQYCRFCGEEKPGANLIDVAKNLVAYNDISTKLHYINAHYVRLDEDGLPTTLCGLCYQTLDKTHNFLMTVKKVQFVLRNLFQPLKEIKKEVDDEPTRASTPESPQMVIDLSDNDGETSLQNATNQSQDKPKESPVVNGSTYQIDIDHDPVSRKLKMHLDSSDTGWNKYKWLCQHCDESFGTRKCLLAHCTEAHNLCAAYKCSTCREDINDYDMFVEHVRKHVKSLRYFCEYCNFECKKVARHIRGRHRKARIYCRYCSAQFNYPKQREIHLRKQTKTLRFKKKGRSGAKQAEISNANKTKLQKDAYKEIAHKNNTESVKTVVNSTDVIDVESHPFTKAVDLCDELKLTERERKIKRELLDMPIIDLDASDSEAAKNNGPTEKVTCAPNLPVNVVNSNDTLQEIARELINKITPKKVPNYMTPTCCVPAMVKNRLAPNRDIVTEPVKDLAKASHPEIIVITSLSSNVPNWDASIRSNTQARENTTNKARVYREQRIAPKQSRPINKAAKETPNANNTNHRNNNIIKARVSKLQRIAPKKSPPINVTATLIVNTPTSDPTMGVQDRKIIKIRPDIMSKICKSVSENLEMNVKLCKNEMSSKLVELLGRADKNAALDCWQLKAQLLQENRLPALLQVDDEEAQSTQASNDHDYIQNRTRYFKLDQVYPLTPEVVKAIYTPHNGLDIKTNEPSNATSSVSNTRSLLKKNITCPNEGSSDLAKERKFYVLKSVKHMEQKSTADENLLKSTEAIKPKVTVATATPEPQTVDKEGNKIWNLRKKERQSYVESSDSDDSRDDAVPIVFESAGNQSTVPNFEIDSGSNNKEKEKNSPQLELVCEMRDKKHFMTLRAAEVDKKYEDSGSDNQEKDENSPQLELVSEMRDKRNIMTLRDAQVVTQYELSQTLPSVPGETKQVVGGTAVKTNSNMTLGEKIKKVLDDLDVEEDRVSSIKGNEEDKPSILAFLPNIKETQEQQNAVEALPLNAEENQLLVPKTEVCNYHFPTGIEDNEDKDFLKTLSGQPALNTDMVTELVENQAGPPLVIKSEPEEPSESQSWQDSTNNLSSHTEEKTSIKRALVDNEVHHESKRLKVVKDDEIDNDTETNTLITQTTLPSDQDECQRMSPIIEIDDDPIDSEESTSAYSNYLARHGPTRTLALPPRSVQATNSLKQQNTLLLTASLLESVAKTLSTNVPPMKDDTETQVIQLPLANLTPENQAKLRRIFSLQLSDNTVQYLNVPLSRVPNHLRSKLQNLAVKFAKHSSLVSSMAQQESSFQLREFQTIVSREARAPATLPLRNMESVDKTWTGYPWACSVCEQTFSKIEVLRLHSRIKHEMCFTMKCADCNENLRDFTDFVRHVELHRRFLQQYCPTCNLKVERPSRAGHMAQHGLMCRTCGATMSDLEALKLHTSKYATLSLSSSKRTVIKGANRTEVYYTCLKCGEQFDCFRFLTEHKYTHTGIEFICDTCKRVFRSKNHLTKHYLRKYRPGPCSIYSEGNQARAAKDKVHSSKGKVQTGKSKVNPGKAKVKPDKSVEKPSKTKAQQIKEKVHTDESKDQLAIEKEQLIIEKEQLIIEKGHPSLETEQPIIKKEQSIVENSDTDAGWGTKKEVTEKKGQTDTENVKTELEKGPSHTEKERTDTENEKREIEKVQIHSEKEQTDTEKGQSNIEKRQRHTEKGKNHAEKGKTQRKKRQTVTEKDPNDKQKKMIKCTQCLKRYSSQRLCDLHMHFKHKVKINNSTTQLIRKESKLVSKKTSTKPNGNSNPGDIIPKVTTEPVVK